MDKWDTQYSRKPNLLINEKSPYLLQHAHNPVDWFPWGDEAFKKARDEDKPIFLSIGYSTCHWCHVMERESFEDEEIGKILNDTFVCIKVDREERPDIDGIYMSVCQMMTGSGGWPLTIIMTPDKKPFFSGTYFPRETMYGRIGVKELAQQIKDVWNERRDEVLRSADSIISHVRLSVPEAKEGEIDNNILEEAYKDFLHTFDEEWGGFNKKPKFPIPHNLILLLRYYVRYKEKVALNMALKTLDNMAMGGMFDQIGFGFHRYSTDREWLVPHFEKMLYDQALLALAYFEAYQITNEGTYKDIGTKILEYVLRDLKGNEGGFYSAEDADSEGVEGKFYVWSTEEIKKCLNDEEAKIAIERYNVKGNGNFLDEATRRRTGLNIFHVKDKNDIGIDDEIRKKLFLEREKRIRPFRDEKVLTDWNSLMISAFMKGYLITKDERYYDAAIDSAEFILGGVKDGKLRHKYYKGEWMDYISLDDYSFFIGALIDLYGGKFETKYLKKAIELSDAMIELFGDEEGGFFFTPIDHEELIVRSKEIYDGAVPSGNSAAYYNLIRLSKITGEVKYSEWGNRTQRIFGEGVTNHPTAYTYFLLGYDYSVGPTSEVVIVGDKNEGTQKLINAVNDVYNPYTSVVYKSSEDNEIDKLIPYIREHKALEGKATAYICSNFACSKPTSDVDEIMNKLKTNHNM